MKRVSCKVGCHVQCWYSHWRQSGKSARRKQIAVAYHQLSPNTCKSPEDHSFSLSLSQVVPRHNYVDKRKLCVSNPCYFEDSSLPTDVWCKDVFRLSSVIFHNQRCNKKWSNRPPSQPSRARVDCLSLSRIRGFSAPDSSSISNTCTKSPIPELNFRFSQPLLYSR